MSDAASDVNPVHHQVNAYLLTYGPSTGTQIAAAMPEHRAWFISALLWEGVLSGRWVLLPGPRVGMPDVPFIRE
jgi:hypothetical protein